jgi:hypothetical protein
LIAQSDVQNAIIDGEILALDEKGRSSLSNEISFNLDLAREATTLADFSYKITPNTISIRIRR